MIEKLLNIEFYKEQYENEIKRKNEINELVKFPTTLLTLFIAGGFYLYKPVFSDRVKNTEEIIILVVAILFTFSIIISIFYLTRMFHNLFRKYYYLPSPEKLKERQIELYNYYKDYFFKNGEIDIENKSIEFSKNQFKKDLLHYYIENSTKNQQVNDNRYKDYYRSRHYLMISLILLAISGLLIILN